MSRLGNKIIVCEGKEVERIRATGEDPTIDEFLDDAFSMTTTELAQAAGVDEKAIDDYFRQNFGFTD